MRALFLICSLKPAGEESNTEALARVMADELETRGVQCEFIRTRGKNILPGSTSDEGDGDDWPAIKKKIIAYEILVIGSPTWVGRMSSEAQRVVERLNGMFQEQDAKGRPLAYNHVAGFVATGNSDGAKHVIGELAAALTEIGFTVPGQSWAYFNQGSSAGPAYSKADANQKERSHKMCRIAASNLVSAARAFHKNPVSVPPENPGA